MKSFKTFILPALLIFAGVGSALAMHTNNKSNKLAIQGYVYRPNEVVTCQATLKFCDNNGTYDCVIGTSPNDENLFILDETGCPEVLKHSMPN